MKKGWLIGCGIAGVLGIAVCAGVGVLVYGIFAVTQPVVDASKDFIGLLGEGKVADAYASTAAGFRAQQDEASFAAAVKQLGLGDIASTTWHNRQIRNQEGAADGTATTKAGATMPVSIRLVKEGGAWKVVAVRYAGVELSTIRVFAPVPADAELRRMALTALQDFNRAVKAKDFTPFYESLSDLWKKETTPEQLQKIFHEFSDKNIDIGGIKDVAAQFAPPAAVNDKGTLVLAGHYPTQPSRVRFQLEYIHEPAGWRLTAIQVNVGKD